MSKPIPNEILFNIFDFTKSSDWLNIILTCKLWKNCATIVFTKRLAKSNLVCECRFYISKSRFEGNNEDYFFSDNGTLNMPMFYDIDMDNIDEKTILDTHKKMSDNLRYLPLNYNIYCDILKYYYDINIKIRKIENFTVKPTKKRNHNLRLD